MNRLPIVTEAPYLSIRHHKCYYTVCERCPLLHKGDYFCTLVQVYKQSLDGVTKPYEQITKATVSSG